VANIVRCRSPKVAPSTWVKMGVPKLKPQKTTQYQLDMMDTPSATDKFTAVHLIRQA
jgi:hypothetical protein